LLNVIFRGANIAKKRSRSSLEVQLS